MKLVEKLVFPLLLFSAEARSEDLQSLSVFVDAHGVEELIDHVQLTSIELEGVTYIELEDELRLQGSGEIIDPASKWKLESLSTGSGISLFLGHGYHYFSHFPVSALGLEECPASMASSGTAFKTHPNGTVVNFSWSCGSGGCSFWFKLGEGFPECS